MSRCKVCRCKWENHKREVTKGPAGNKVVILTCKTGHKISVPTRAPYMGQGPAQ